MGGHFGRTSRRQFIQASARKAVVELPMGVGLGAHGDATAQQGEQSGLVGPPSWRFHTHQVQDPYGGAIQVPQEAPGGTRYVGVEVEVVNEADQALNFTPIDVYVRIDSGVDIRGGGALGAEPSINPRNLNPGERSRGWVWFIVPEDAVPVEIVYIAPQPQFRVPLPL